MKLNSLTFVIATWPYKMFGFQVYIFINTLYYTLFFIQQLIIKTNVVAHNIPCRYFLNMITNN